MAQLPVLLDRAEIWQEAHKTVFSKTLPTVASAGTQIEREFVRSCLGADEVRRAAESLPR
jgi:hypothetical protein